MGKGGARSWTWVTSVKLDVLKNYLGRFTTACLGKSPTCVYIDLFAGGPVNVDHEGNELVSSAQLALRTEPSFTALRFVELPSKAEQLRIALESEFPNRDLKVFAGDCNQAIIPLLRDLAPKFSHAPTFAFVDPDGMEVKWETLQRLATHKHPSRSKVEIWMLFAAPGLMRTLSLDEVKITEQDLLRADGLFGHMGWESIYDRRAAGTITATEARAEYVNLMRWLLEQELGYAFTHEVELRNTHGTPMYTMVFATDNKAGNAIMGHLYADAHAAYPHMKRQQAREKREELGVMSLFDDLDEVFDDGSTTSQAKYQHSPPWRPIGWDEDPDGIAPPD